MATVFLTEKGCFVCGKKNRFPQTGTSMTIMGSKDLDGRPSQIQRSAIYMWVQKCDHCGYCAVDISSGNEGDSSYVKSKEYISQLNDSNYPETANAFLCCTFLYEKNGQLDNAGWCALYAGWICDDNKFTVAAEMCRGRALAFFSKARGLELRFAETPAEEQLVLIDLFRRRGEFSTAMELCERELDKQHPEELLTILFYHKYLIETKDQECHKDVEAEEYADRIENEEESKQY